MESKQALCGSTIKIVSAQPFKLLPPLTKYCKSGDLRQAMTVDDIDVVCTSCSEVRDRVVLDAEVEDDEGTSRELEDPLGASASAALAAPEGGYLPDVSDSSLTAALKSFVASHRKAGAPSGAPKDREALPTVQDILKANGMPTSGSLCGRSKMQSFRKCLFQGYLHHILGLERVPAGAGERTDARTGKVRLSALELGSLVHGCLQTWYETGDAWKLTRALEEHYPALAYEGERLAGAYLERFNKTEQETWDVRGVEIESRYYYQARKCAGKRRRLCISARHDGVYREMKRGDRRLDPGVCAEDGVRLHEIKTSSHLSEQFLRGYHIDEQVLIGLAAYNYGQAVDYDADGGVVVCEQATADFFGPAGGMTVTVIPKKQDLDLADLARFTLMPSEAQLDRYLSSVGDWLYSEIGERLFSEHVLAPETWPPSWQCRDPITGMTCYYLEICERGGDWTKSPEFTATGPRLRGEDLELPGGKTVKASRRGKRRKEAEADGK